MGAGSGREQRAEFSRSPAWEEAQGIVLFRTFRLLPWPFPWGLAAAFLVRVRPLCDLGCSDLEQKLVTGEVAMAD